jgi:hypothetical protein
MKRLILLISLVPMIVSCQSNDYESYKMSWAGVAVAAVIGLAILVVFILQKRAVDETKENTNTALKDGSTVDFKSMGSYIGGHPASENMIPTAAFRRNSDCCMFFYKDRSYDMPEFKFKIKIKSIKNVSVEDLPSIEKKFSSGGINLAGEAITALRKKRKRPMAFITIDWTDGQLNHSTVFSFEGSDAMQKANNAKDNFLRALN